MPSLSANTPSAHLEGRNRPLVRAMAWSAVSLAAVVWTLSVLKIDRSGSDAAHAANLRHLWPYWLASASCWIGLTLLWLSLRRDGGGSGSGAGLRARESQPILDERPRRPALLSAQALIVFAVAITARIVVLIAHEPSLSDDVYRYVYDGRNLAHGLNPFLTDPDDRIAALAGGAAENWTGERDLLRLLAYPEITTPYLPLSQYVFATLGWVCERGGWVSPLDSARVFRIGFTAIEIGLMLVLLAALRRHAMSPWWLALYAWHPLPLSEFAGSGHQDVIGIALLAGVLLACGHPGQARGYVRIVAWAALLGGSMMVKPLALLAAPLIVRTRPLRAWIITALVAGVVGAIVCLLLALPLRFLPGQPPYAAWKTTADWMTEKAAHFAGLYEPMLCVVRHKMTGGPNPKPGFNLDQEWLARKICWWTFVGVGIVILLRARNAWRATAALLLALTLCSTTCHPWYLLWALALFPLGGCWTLWAYSLTIAWGYVVFVTGKGHAFAVEWTVAPWAIAAAYIPVAVAIFVDVTLHVRRARAKPQAANP